MAKPAPAPNPQALARIEAETPGTLALSQLSGRIQKIQMVMRTQMKEGVHYGTIPGTPKPSLLSAGSDMLAVTFQIALEPEILEARSDDDEAEYRVRVKATSQESGNFLGASEGICSTAEKKYRWRRPVHPKEWEAADPTRRRVTWDRDGYEIKQVRQEPGDVANTILQMAIKRAKVSCIRIVTGCSDIFAQDLEDLPEHLAKDSVPMTPPAGPQPVTTATKVALCHCPAAGGAHGHTPEPNGPCPETPVAAPPGPVAPPAASDASGAPVAPTPAPVEAEPAGEDVPGVPGQHPSGALKPLSVLGVKKAKTGTSAKGPWTLWAVQTSEGEFVTFSSTDAGVAAKAKVDNRQVFIQSKDNGRGGREIVEIGVAA